MAIESHLDFYRRWNRLAAPYFAWQFQQFDPYLGRRVADIGCDPGNLTPHFADKELYVGVDLDPDMLQELNAASGDARHVQTLCGDARDPAVARRLQELAIDTVVSANLLEHLEDDQAAATNMLAALPAGGTLALLVPAMPGIYGTLDALDHHYRRYTRKTLAKLLADAGAEVVRMHYFNMIGALGWWLKGVVLKQEQQEDANYKLMNALIPVLRPLERAVSPPFGLSLIAIARKPHLTG